MIQRKLTVFEQRLDRMIQDHEELLALVQRRNDDADKELINSIEEALSDLVDAHVHNTDARSFERAYRRKEK